MLRILARKAIASASANLNSIPHRRGLCLGVLPDGLDRNSESFVHNSKAMEALISQLQLHINKVYYVTNMYIYLYI